MRNTDCADDHAICIAVRSLGAEIGSGHSSCGEDFLVDFRNACFTDPAVDFHYLGCILFAKQIGIVLADDFLFLEANKTCGCLVA